MIPKLFGSLKPPPRAPPACDSLQLPRSKARKISAAARLSAADFLAGSYARFALNSLKPDIDREGSGS
jgi:hypothetical protein